MTNAKLRSMEIASRVAAAALEGYALAAATAVCTLVLPLVRSEAVLIGSSMISFVIYVCAVLWVFAATNAGRAWLGLVLPGLILGGTVLLVLP